MIDGHNQDKNKFNEAEKLESLFSFERAKEGMWRWLSGKSACLTSIRT